MRGFRESEEVTYCIYNEQLIVVPFKVHTCSKHIHRTRPSSSQMEDLAIPINNETKKPVGFWVEPETECEVELSTNNSDPAAVDRM